MGRVDALCVNKSGYTYPVYNLETNKKVGDIFNREAYIFVGSEGGLEAIIFLGPNGSLVSTEISVDSHPYQNGFRSWCEDYAYGSEYIYGDSYNTYKMNRTEEVYCGDGTRWGTVARSMRVASLNSDVGTNHSDWKQINYVENTSHEWIKVDGNGYGFGYVDTGLARGSNPSTISLYGSW